MDGPVDRLHTVVYTALSYGLSLPKGDDCEHSHNSAHCSITPPCQNRGPVKYERKTLWIRPCVGASDDDNLSTQRRVLADCEQVLEDVGSGVFWNRPGLNLPKAALAPGDCVKVAGLDRLGRSLTELLSWLKGEPGRGHQSQRVDRPGQRHGPGHATPGHRLRGDGVRAWPGSGGLERVKATGKIWTGADQAVRFAMGPCPITARMRFFSFSRNSAGFAQTMWL